jgi:uncharacterized membrane protein YwzB
MLLKIANFRTLFEAPRMPDQRCCHSHVLGTFWVTQSTSTPVFQFLKVPNIKMASLYHILSVVASTTVSSFVVSPYQSPQRHFRFSKNFEFNNCFSFEGSLP